MLERFGLAREGACRLHEENYAKGLFFCSLAIDDASSEEPDVPRVPHISSSIHLCSCCFSTAPLKLMSIIAP